MIITLTGNLLAERTLEFERWQPGRTQRARAESFQVGGKGINVSRMLRRFGVETEAWCFAGGATGAECGRWLESRALPHRIFTTSADTRAGVVVRAPGAPETTFLGTDRAPDAEALLRCAEALEGARERGRWLVLCGSFPGWNSDDAGPLRHAIDGWVQAGAFVADTYGAPLQWCVERPTALVKVNKDEFDAVEGATPPSSKLCDRLQARVSRGPVAAWVVTDGPNAVAYASKEESPGEVLPPSIKEVSATGSGDVLLAALLNARTNRQLGLADSLKFALPYAAANAAHPGVAEFDLNLLPFAGSLHS